MGTVQILTMGDRVGHRIALLIDHILEFFVLYHPGGVEQTIFRFVSVSKPTHKAIPPEYKITLFPFNGHQFKSSTIISNPQSPKSSTQPLNSTEKQADTTASPDNTDHQNYQGKSITTPNFPKTLTYKVNSSLDVYPSSLRSFQPIRLWPYLRCRRPEMPRGHPAAQSRALRNHRGVLFQALLGNLA